MPIFSTLGCMFVHLSHILDPGGPHWPSSPALSMDQRKVLGEDGDSNDYISHLPNHFGTHMDLSLIHISEPTRPY